MAMPEASTSVPLEAALGANVPQVENVQPLSANPNSLRAKAAEFARRAFGVGGSQQREAAAPVAPVAAASTERAIPAEPGVPTAVEPVQASPASELPEWMIELQPSAADVVPEIPTPPVPAEAEAAVATSTEMPVPPDATQPNAAVRAEAAAPIPVVLGTGDIRKDQFMAATPKALNELFNAPVDADVPFDRAGNQWAPTYTEGANTYKLKTTDGDRAVYEDDYGGQKEFSFHQSQESGQMSEYDEALAEADSTAEVVDALEDRLDALEASATENSRAVEGLEEEQDRLRTEFATVDRYASRKLPRAKGEFADRERQLIRDARTRRNEIQARLAEIEGDEENDGLLAEAKAKCTKEELTTEARRLRKIRQLRGETEKWRALGENPVMWSRYQELRGEIAQAERNFAPSVAAMVTESAREEMAALQEQMPRVLLEDEGYADRRRSGDVVALDTAEENLVYNRAIDRLRGKHPGGNEDVAREGGVFDTDQRRAGFAKVEAEERGKAESEQARADELALEQRQATPMTEGELANFAQTLGLPDDVARELAQSGPMTVEQADAGRGLMQALAPHHFSEERAQELAPVLSAARKGLQPGERQQLDRSVARQVASAAGETAHDQTLPAGERRKRLKGLRAFNHSLETVGEFTLAGVGKLLDILIGQLVETLK